MIKKWNWWGDLKMTHDYKAALDYINSNNLGVQPAVIIDTIIHALRIADKLMKEPSDGMCNSGSKRFEIMWGDAQCVFEDMRDQMLKEVQDEK